MFIFGTMDGHFIFVTTGGSLPDCLLLCSLAYSGMVNPADHPAMALPHNGLTGLIQTARRKRCLRVNEWNGDKMMKNIH